MRTIALGSWTYYLWHLPACALLALMVACALGALRSLRLDEYGPRERRLRWNIVGWSSLFAGALSLVSWSHVGAVARVDVGPDGAWHLSNYLGIPLATVRPDEARELRGAELGGAGFGAGNLELRTARGLWRSVRITRPALDGMLAALGYRAASVHDRYGDRTVDAHSFTAQGPVFGAR